MLEQTSSSNPSILKLHPKLPGLVHMLGVLAVSNFDPSTIRPFSRSILPADPKLPFLIKLKELLSAPPPKPERGFGDHLVRLLFPHGAAELERLARTLSPEDLKNFIAELTARWTSVKQAVLDFIAKHEGRDLAYNYIAQGTGLSERSVKNAANYLVKSGLVVRTRRKASKRTLGYPNLPNQYRLTEKGWAKAKVRPTQNKSVSSENKEDRPSENKPSDLVHIFTQGKVIIASDSAGLRPTLAPLATQGADADFQPRPSYRSNPKEHAEERARGRVKSSTDGSQQSTSVATGKGGSGGKTPRTSKPETPEEKTVLDLYEQGMPKRRKSLPDTWHDRKSSLRALRSFEYKHPAVPLAVLLEYLKNALASDFVFPFKNKFFSMWDLVRNWQVVVGGPLKKPPMKKPIAQAVLERDRPVSEDIQEFGPEWWFDVRKTHHIVEFEKFTGYMIDERSGEVCLDFLARIGETWEKHMVNGEDLSPSLLMTKVIDACIDEFPRTLCPNDFILHRDRLRRKEA